MAVDGVTSILAFICGALPDWSTKSWRLRIWPPINLSSLTPYDVGHGFGLGTGTSAGGWLYEAVEFWEKFQ